MSAIYPKRFHSSVVWALIIFVAAAGCSQKKHLLADAKQMEEAGMLQSAMDSYRLVYDQYQEGNALIAMNRVSQQILNQKCNQAVALCMGGQHDEGLNLFAEAKRFQQANSQFEIKMPLNAETQIQQCKTGYIQELIKQAEAALMNLELNKAESLLNRIFSLDYDNVEAKSLSLLLEIIPSYNEGQKAFELELWRDAYHAFNKVCRLDASYRDAKSKRDEALQNGHISLAYIIKDGVAPIKVAQSLGSSIKGELLDLKDPFLDLLERSDLEILIREQQSSLSAEYDADQGPEAGKLRRANFILYGEIISYKINTEPERTLKCDCANTLGIYSDKVECFEYNQRRTLELSMRYQLVDAESGKIFMADVIQTNKSDVGVRYDFQIGKKISLTSATLQRDHDVDLTRMKQPKEDLLQSESELCNLANEQIAKEIAKKMANFKP
jgi:hypothetical protein